MTKHVRFHDAGKWAEELHPFTQFEVAADQVVPISDELAKIVVEAKRGVIYEPEEIANDLVEALTDIMEDDKEPEDTGPVMEDDKDDEEAAALKAAEELQAKMNQNKPKGRGGRPRKAK